VRHHLSEGMWLAALRLTKMVGELAMLQATMSSAMESVLGRPPSDAFHMEVVGDLPTKFQKMEHRLSRLEWPAMRICHLLLGPPTDPA
jgi:hypothetical protein